MEARSRWMCSWWICFCLPTLGWVSGGRATRHEYHLIQDLLDEYDTDMRPVLNPHDTINVSLDLTLHQVMDLDERNQILTANFWLRYKWIDQHLKWDPAKYGNISQIRLSVGRIWKPDITLYTDVGVERRDIEGLFPACVFHDGVVRWHANTIFLSTCKLDVTYFPWDQQRCEFEFCSWTFNKHELDLHNTSPSADVDHFIEDGEWQLMNIPVERRVEIFNGDPFRSLVFTVHIKRKPMYYIINLILPCIFITLCGVLVFLLPPDSGEKVSLAVTILLASTVFLLIVAESMPPQSSVVPLIGKYFLAAITILVLCVLVTVLLLNRQFCGALCRPVPPLLRRLVLDWLAGALLLKRAVSTNLARSASQRAKDSYGCEMSREEEHAAPHRALNNGKGALHGREIQQADEEDCRRQWMLVVLVMDRLFFVLFLIVIIVCTTSMLLSHP